MPINELRGDKWMVFVDRPSRETIYLLPYNSVWNRVENALLSKECLLQEEE